MGPASPAYHGGTEALGHGVLRIREQAEKGTRGTAHSGGGSGDGIEGQKRAEADSGTVHTDDESSRSHVGTVWVHVVHKKQTGATIGEVWRPELEILGTPQVLWELHAQATTGWNTEVRGLISKEVLRKVVLSRKVLESIHRVTERDRAMMHGVSVGELPGMDLGAIMMTPQIAQTVWTNVNKLKGLKETGGPGRQRYWACINMLLWEGAIEGDVGVHPRDMEWEGMAV